MIISKSSVKSTLEFKHLAFKRVEIEDKASYTVQVSNMVGQAEGKMTLAPKGWFY